MTGNDPFNYEEPRTLAEAKKVLGAVGLTIERREGFVEVEYFVAPKNAKEWGGYYLDMATAVEGGMKTAQDAKAAGVDLKKLFEIETRADKLARFQVKPENGQFVVIAPPNAANPNSQEIFRGDAKATTRWLDEREIRVKFDNEMRANPGQRDALLDARTDALSEMKARHRAEDASTSRKGGKAMGSVREAADGFERKGGTDPEAPSNSLKR